MIEVLRCMKYGDCKKKQNKMFYSKLTGKLLIRLINNEYTPEMKKVISSMNGSKMVHEDPMRLFEEISTVAPVPTLLKVANRFERFWKKHRGAVPRGKLIAHSIVFCLAKQVRVKMTREFGIRSKSHFECSTCTGIACLECNQLCQIITTMAL